MHASHRAVLLRKGWEDALWAGWRAVRATQPTLDVPARKAGMRPCHYDALAQSLTPGPNYYAGFGWDEPMAQPNARGSYPYRWPV